MESCRWRCSASVRLVLPVCSPGPFEDLPELRGPHVQPWQPISVPVLSPGFNWAGGYGSHFADETHDASVLYISLLSRAGWEPRLWRGRGDNRRVSSRTARPRPP